MNAKSLRLWIVNLAVYGLLFCSFSPLMDPSSASAGRFSLLDRVMKWRGIGAEYGVVDPYFQYNQYVQDLYQRLYSFNTGSVPEDGHGPIGSLVQASDGSFYGATMGGGKATTDGVGGTVFRLSPSGHYAVLHRFTDLDANDGAMPGAGPIQGGDGYLYGTTERGGAKGGGTVYRISTSGQFAVLHSFDGSKGEGEEPEAPLVQTKNGYLYGTTYAGGTHGQGTVFRITTAGELLTVHSFGLTATDGGDPYGGLVESDSYLYGTCQYGGAYGNGAAFRVDQAGSLSILHSFSNSEGAFPLGRLVPAGDGNLYGALGSGVIYRMSPSGTVTVIHDFSNEKDAEDGNWPNGDLIQGTDGFLYGTTTHGGPANGGVAYRMDLNGNEQLLHSFFEYHDGYIPNGGLIQGTDGRLYGETAAGGSAGYGMLYRLDLFSNLVFQDSSTNAIGLWDVDQKLNVVDAATVDVVPPHGWNVVGQGDFQGNNIPPDLLVKNGSTGQVSVWYMEAAVRTGGTPLSKSPGAGSTVGGVGDFNGDGKPDLLIQNGKTRQLTIWYLDGAQVVSESTISRIPSSDVRVVGVANLGGPVGIVVQNITNYQLGAWLMNGSTVESAEPISAVVPAGWKATALSTISGHVEPDIVFQNGQHVMVWTLSGLNVTNKAMTPTAVPAGWNLVGP